MLKIIRTDAENADFQELVCLLNEDLSIRDGADHNFYAQFNKIEGLKNVVLVYQNEVAVGCGAFKEFDAHSVEVKRMFVRPERRGQGIAKAILSELEKWAAESGYQDAVLETGQKQPEALNLYAGCGYEVIPKYGQYQGVENSVCFCKSLR